MNPPTLETITGEDTPEKTTPARSRWRRRLVAAIPWLLLAGFALLAWVLFGDRLSPAKSVQTESVVTLRQAIDGGPSGEQAGNPFEAPALFQASGWIEPDPLPIKATALVNGVIDTVTVLEGQTVRKDDRLATLIREDFELDLATAESELKSLQAQSKAHEQAIEAAAAKIKTQHKKIEAGRTKCDELSVFRDRMVGAKPGVFSAAEIEETKLKVLSHSAEVDALAAEEAELKADKARLEAIRENYAADIGRAETEVARRELALDRTEIRSPVDGVVLRLLAVPGQKRMLDMDDADSATVAILYEPDSLQARIDVPLEEAAKLSVGQAVRLRSSFLSDRVFQGIVTRIVGEADLQRNTLQAKVRIENPDDRLRPEMLCRAEFLAATASTDASSEIKGGTSPATAGGRVVVFVPETALVNRKGSEAEAWTVDSENRLEQRSLKLGSEKRDGYLRVREGLLPGDRVVVDPSPDLAEGDRVQPQSGKGKKP